VGSPSGSRNDDEVIKACNDHNIVLALTNLRLFHHWLLLMQNRRGNNLFLCYYIWIKKLMQKKQPFFHFKHKYVFLLISNSINYYSLNRKLYCNDSIIN